MHIVLVLISNKICSLVYPAYRLLNYFGMFVLGVTLFLYDFISFSLFGPDFIPYSYGLAQPGNVPIRLQMTLNHHE